MNAKWIRNALLAAVAIAGGAAAKTSGVPVPDDEISKKIQHEIRMYPRYSIFDDVKFRVQNGNVALLGEVSQPYKKAELGRILANVDGVVAVDNSLKVAPLSGFDDRLRLQIASAIYRDPVLSRYGAGTLPSIHILVDNGRVTLEGVVDDEASKNVAGLRAASGLSFGPVTNNLQVAKPAPKKN